jgi:predicted nucleotidyltransferase
MTKDEAIGKAIRVTETMNSLGVVIEVIGSLANGRFNENSDIDFLVRECPRSLKYAIEGKIEDIVHPLAFDVVYFDEIPPHKLERLTRGTRDARSIC